MLLHEFGFKVRSNSLCLFWDISSFFLFSFGAHISLFVWIFPTVCLREFLDYLQLLYELCLDPLTGGPTMDLLSSKKYQFFVKVKVHSSFNMWCSWIKLWSADISLSYPNCCFLSSFLICLLSLQHLDTIGVAPLPKRNNNQALRISSLHQVSSVIIWLLWYHTFCIS